METGSGGGERIETMWKDGKLFCVQYRKGIRTNFHRRRRTGTMKEVAERMLQDEQPKKKELQFGEKRYRSRKKRSKKQQSLI